MRILPRSLLLAALYARPGIDRFDDALRALDDAPRRADGDDAAVRRLRSAVLFRRDTWTP